MYKRQHRKIGTGSIGPVVRQLRDLYFDIVRGKVPRYRHWNVPVYETESHAAAQGKTGQQQGHAG